MCCISAIRMNRATRPHRGQGGNGVCPRSHISSECECCPWSGRQMPETGTISPLRKEIWLGCFLDCSGTTALTALRKIEPFPTGLIKATLVPVQVLKTKKMPGYGQQRLVIFPKGTCAFDITRQGCLQFLQYAHKCRQLLDPENRNKV